MINDPLLLCMDDECSKKSYSIWNDDENHAFSDNESSNGGVNILNLGVVRQEKGVKAIRKTKSINDIVKSDRRVLQIRKNQFDATAALVYGLNISLIHFALFIMTVFIVRYPNVDLAI